MTGVQTCALPIWIEDGPVLPRGQRCRRRGAWMCRKPPCAASLRPGSPAGAGRGPAGHPARSRRAQCGHGTDRRREGPPRPGAKVELGVLRTVPPTEGSAPPTVHPRESSRTGSPGPELPWSRAAGGHSAAVFPFSGDTVWEQTEAGDVQPARPLCLPSGPLRPVGRGASRASSGSGTRRGVRVDRKSTRLNSSH